MQRFEELSSVEYQTRNETNELYIPPGPRLGETVVEVNNLCKAYDGQVLIDDLSFILPKGAIVGIIGPNGAGKSTLFRMLTGIEKPDSGSIKLGDTVVTAYVEQFRDQMKNENTVFDEISQGQDILRVGSYEIPARAYIGRFNFRSTDQQKRVGDLSGGERGRLQLAKLLQVGGNLLLLDEPTNDLDVETLRALENALLEFLALPWLSLMTAGSLTVLPPIFLIMVMKARFASSRVTIPSMKHGRRQILVKRHSLTA